MPPPPELQPRQRRYSVRHQARLDAETHAKLEALATVLHRKRSAILRFVRQWGLPHSEGWTIDQFPVVAVPPVPVLLEPDLLHQVQEAADSHSVPVAGWLRQAMRQVTQKDFPPSWHAEAARGGRPRSHDSRYCGQRFMLRLDDETSAKLGTLIQTFDRSAAEIIRQLIAQARPEEFPPSWHLAVNECRAPPDHVEVPGV
jgi:predicted transcriptional regulator